MFLGTGEQPQSFLFRVKGYSVAAAEGWEIQVEPSGVEGDPESEV